MADFFKEHPKRRNPTWCFEQWRVKAKRTAILQPVGNMILSGCRFLSFAITYTHLYGFWISDTSQTCSKFVYICEESLSVCCLHPDERLPAPLLATLYCKYIYEGMLGRPIASLTSSCDVQIVVLQLCSHIKIQSLYSGTRKSRKPQREDQDGRVQSEARGWEALLRSCTRVLELWRTKQTPRNASEQHRQHAHNWITWAGSSWPLEPINVKIWVVFTMRRAVALLAPLRSIMMHSSSIFRTSFGRASRESLNAMRVKL